jgi:hypothetical protein
MHAQLGGAEAGAEVVEHLQAGPQRGFGSATVPFRQPQQRVGVPPSRPKLRRTVPMREADPGQLAPCRRGSAQLDRGPGHDQPSVQCFHRPARTGQRRRRSAPGADQGVRSLAALPQRAQGEVGAQGGPSGALLAGRGSPGPLGLVAGDRGIAVQQRRSREQQPGLYQVDCVALASELDHRRLGGAARLDDEQRRHQRLGPFDRQQPRIPAGRPVAVLGLVEGRQGGRQVSPDSGRQAPVVVHRRRLAQVAGRGVQRLRAVQILLGGPPVSPMHVDQAAVVADVALQHGVAARPCQHFQRLVVAVR